MREEATIPVAILTSNSRPHSNSFHTDTHPAEVFKFYNELP